MLTDIAEAARKTAIEFFGKAGLKAGQTVIVGCSTSEIAGAHIGTLSSADIGAAVFEALSSVFSEVGVYIAAQCCEHLNRAIIIEREAAAGYTIVNAIPAPGAGGAFAAAAYAKMNDPVAVETIATDAGLDIGCTLIGMHLRRVAVPVRLDNSFIGKAPVIAARTRPPLIGGVRAAYDDRLT